MRPRRAPVLARLEALEAAAARRVAPDNEPAFWADLKALAAKGRGDLPLARMSTRQQAALVIFGDASREEAEWVAARFEAAGCPLDGLAKVIRELLATLDRNEGRKVIGIPPLPLPGRDRA